MLCLNQQLWSYRSSNHGLPDPQVWSSSSKLVQWASKDVSCEKPNWKPIQRYSLLLSLFSMTLPWNSFWKLKSQSRLLVPRFFLYQFRGSMPMSSAYQRWNSSKSIVPLPSASTYPQIDGPSMGPWRSLGGFGQALNIWIRRSGYRPRPTQPRLPFCQDPGANGNQILGWWWFCYIIVCIYIYIIHIIKLGWYLPFYWSYQNSSASFYELFEVNHQGSRVQWSSHHLRCVLGIPI